jgi:hypothetical protein
MNIFITSLVFDKLLDFIVNSFKSFPILKSCEKVDLEQRSQTSGPPDGFVWPVLMSKTDQIFYIDLTKRTYLVNSGPQKLLS